MIEVAKFLTNFGRELQSGGGENTLEVDICFHVNYIDLAKDIDINSSKRWGWS